MGVAKSGPTAPKCSDEEFIDLVTKYGAKWFSDKFGGTERNVYSRRRRLEAKYGDVFSAPTKQAVQYPGRVPLELNSGEILVGSDFHIWPGEASTCLRAFKKFVADIKPAAVILNGDVMDFPRISRHPQNWEKAPDPQEEIEAAQDHLNDIVTACKRGAHKIWTQGNHDMRLEALFANASPQMRGLKGVHLYDHFSAVWQRAMSCMVNEGTSSATMIKHIPVGGGINATRTFTAKAGINTVHSHLHRQSVQSVSDYRSVDYYGVDTGMVADKEHRAFLYAQDAPLDWRSGFALLTYRDGRLMPPELITKMSSNTVWFRGALHKV